MHICNENDVKLLRLAVNYYHNKFYNRLTTIIIPAIALFL